MFLAIDHPAILVALPDSWGSPARFPWCAPTSSSRLAHRCCGKDFSRGKTPRSLGSPLRAKAAALKPGKGNGPEESNAFAIRAFSHFFLPQKIPHHLGRFRMAAWVQMNAITQIKFFRICGIFTKQIFKIAHFKASLLGKSQENLASCAVPKRRKITLKVEPYRSSGSRQFFPPPARAAALLRAQECAGSPATSQQPAG